MAVTPGALEGVRVVDLTGRAFGYAGRVLAALGADVIKVEPPGGDPVRTYPPFRNDVPDIEGSGRHLFLNAGKRSLTLDIETEDGAALLRRLVARSHVVIESFAPGYLRSRSLDYDSLLALRPGLVMASISHFGQDGPYAGYKSEDIVDGAISGYLLLTGDPDREPVKPYDDVLQMQAALHAAVAIAAGVFVSEATGEGDYFDVAAIDAALFLHGGPIQNYHFTHTSARRRGTRLLNTQPRGLYPSCLRPVKDGWIHTHSNTRHTDLISLLMDEPRLASPEILATPNGLADEIDALMAPWLTSHGKFDAVRLAQEIRLPFTEVLLPSEILKDEHLRERGFFVPVEQPGLGQVTQLGASVKMRGAPWQVHRAPTLGEHTAAIRAELSGPPAPEARPSAAGQRPAKAGRPLEGIRVVDFTTAVAGPVASMLLCDLGAEVIKIEQPWTRTSAPPTPIPPREGAPDHPYNRVASINELQRGKRHFPVDLSTAEGRDIFLDLVAKSDIVVENFSPRVMGNLGIEFDQLKAVNPAIIMISMPAFGKTGPYANRTSYGPGIDAMSGLSHLTGYPDRGPGKPANFFCDQNAGLTAALVAISALRRKRRTGAGEYIEVPMFEGELPMIAPALMDAMLNHRDQDRIGNRHEWLAPHGLYRCTGEESWVAIAVQDEAQWSALCRVIGRDKWATASDLNTAAKRRARQDEIDAAIEAWTCAQDKARAQDTLQQAGIAAGAVQDVSEVFGDPQILHRRSIVWADHLEIGAFPHCRAAWLSRRGNDGVSGPGPLYGEGVDHVLSDLLGKSPEAIAELIAKRVVAREPN